MHENSLLERLAHLLGSQAGRPVDDWADFVAPAQALLRAMRVPTARMARAGADIPVGCCMTNSSDAGEVWEYMIDAALAESPVAVPATAGPVVGN